MTSQNAAHRSSTDFHGMGKDEPEVERPESIEQHGTNITMGYEGLGEKMTELLPASDRGFRQFQSVVPLDRSGSYGSQIWSVGLLEVFRVKHSATSSYRIFGKFEASGPGGSIMYFYFDIPRSPSASSSNPSQRVRVVIIVPSTSNITITHTKFTTVDSRTIYEKTCRPPCQWKEYSWEFGSVNYLVGDQHNVSAGSTNEDMSVSMRQVDLKWPNSETKRFRFAATNIWRPSLADWMLIADESSSSVPSPSIRRFESRIAALLPDLLQPIVPKFFRKVRHLKGPPAGYEETFDDQDSEESLVFSTSQGGSSSGVLGNGWIP